MSSSPPLVLTFAASDPTGGAGLQADVLTLASLGCHPLSVVTALTVQDTSGVEQLEAAGVLHGGRGDDRERMTSEARERQDVGLQSRAAGRIGCGEGEHQRRR